jgi:uncharacterized protein (DUF1778 family)
MVLSNRDRDLVLSLLKTPPEPNAKLKKLLLKASYVSDKYKGRKNEK